MVENLKGGMNLAATGYIQLRAFTSTAQLPLPNVAVVITSSDGTAIAMRITNRNGLIAPIELPVPDKSESQEPDSDELPYARINLYAYVKGYELIESRDIQIFADTTTVQDLEMIPAAEHSDNSDIETEIFDTPPQDL